MLAACSEGLSEREATIPVPGAVAAPVGGRVPTQPANVPGAGESSANTEMTGQSIATTTGADTLMAASTTTASPEISATRSATTTTAHELDVYAPERVVEVQPGDSFGLITDRYGDETIAVATVRAENGIEGETIFPGRVLNICVDNGLDDIIGSERERNEVVVEAETTVAIEAQ